MTEELREELYQEYYQKYNTDCLCEEFGFCDFILEKFLQLQSENAEIAMIAHIQGYEKAKDKIKQLQSDKEEMAEVLKEDFKFGMIMSDLTTNQYFIRYSENIKILEKHYQKPIEEILNNA